MEDRAQRILAAILGTKLLARWVQRRSFTATSIATGNLLILSKQQPVSAAIKADQSSFQSYSSGVHGNNRLDRKSLLDCVVFGRVSGVACARNVLGDNTKAASLEKCMEVPESCSTGVDEMRENDEHDQNGSAGKSRM